MTTETELDPRFLSEAQSFAICMICDFDYPRGTATCQKCGTTLSEVRRCPNCKRVLSSKHERCIYCSTSFLVEEKAEEVAPTTVPLRKSQKTDHSRAVLFCVLIFLAVFLGSIAFQQFRTRGSGSTNAADSYLYEATPTRNEPSGTAPNVATLAPGTVINVVEIANDAKGDRWVEIATGAEKKEYVPLAAIAPPKVRNLERGAPILRVWLTSFDNPAHVSEAVAAVNYLCTEYKNPPQCEELRWVLFGRMRYLRTRTSSRELSQKTKEVLESIAAGKGPHAQAAAEALKELSSAAPEQEKTGDNVERVTTESSKPLGMQPRQYSLVDRAEVHVRIRDLGSLKTGQSLQAPIAAPIIVNGEMVVPANAICLLKVVNSNPNRGSVTLELLALEFNNRHFDVQTDAKQVAMAGSTVVFEMNSSLLIGR